MHIYRYMCIHSIYVCIYTYIHIYIYISINQSQTRLRRPSLPTMSERSRQDGRRASAHRSLRLAGSRRSRQMPPLPPDASLSTAGGRIDSASLSADGTPLPTRGPTGCPKGVRGCPTNTHGGALQSGRGGGGPRLLAEAKVPGRIAHQSVD